MVSIVSTNGVVQLNSSTSQSAENGLFAPNSNEGTTNDIANAANASQKSTGGDGFHAAPEMDSALTSTYSAQASSGSHDSAPGNVILSGITFPQFLTLPNVPNPASLRISLSAFDASFGGSTVSFGAFEQDMPPNSVIDLWGEPDGSISMTQVGLNDYATLPRFDSKLHVARLQTGASGFTGIFLRGDMGLLDGQLSYKPLDATVFKRDMIIPTATVQWSPATTLNAGDVFQTPSGALYRVVRAGTTGGTPPNTVGNQWHGSALIDFVGAAQYAGAWKRAQNDGINWRTGSLAAGRLAATMPTEVKQYLQAAIKGLVRDWGYSLRVEVGMRMAGPNTAGTIWECVTAGTTSNVAFLASAAVGTTVTESNGVTWRAVGQYGGGNASWFLTDTAPDMTTALMPAGHSSYAATLLWAVQQYVAATGDTAWLNEASVHQGYSNAAVLKEVLYANILTQFDAGLCKTFQNDISTSGASYAGRTLFDNAEVWAGLNAGVALYTRLGDTDWSNYVAAFRAGSIAGIESLWQADAGAYRYAAGADMNAAPAQAQFYPYVISQYWMAQFGIPVDSVRLASAATYADNHFSNWQLRMDTGEHAELGAHYGRYMMGHSADLADVLETVRNRHLRDIPYGSLQPASISSDDAALYLVMNALPSAPPEQPAAPSASPSMLGLANGSSALLGQAGLFAHGASGASREAAYVNAATGNLVLRTQDDRLASAGADLSFNRTYNSLGNAGGTGKWLTGPVRRLQLSGTANSAGSYVVRSNEDGSSQVFHFDAALNMYRSTDGAGAHDVLRWDAGQQRWFWQDVRQDMQGLYEMYGVDGRLLATGDQLGPRITYEYNTAGQLSKLTDSSGDITRFDYESGRLARIRTTLAAGAASHTRVHYGYDTEGRLSTVTVDLTPEDSSIADGKVYTTTYTYYDGGDRVRTLTQSDGTKLAFTYTADGKVETMADGENRTVRFDYSTPGQTKLTDSLGNSSIYEYNGQGELTAVTAPAINDIPQVTRFQYDTQGNMTRMTSPSGLATVYEYDANGNRVLERDAAGNTVTRRYDQVRNLLLRETTYAVADPDGSGDAQPGAPMHRYMAYDSQGRLRFSVSAEGMVTEYGYNAENQLGAELRYTAARFNVPANTLELSEATLAAWVAGPNSGREFVMRADFGYDFRGQLNAVTRFAKTDANGNGIFDGNQSISFHVRDHAGLLRQTIVHNATVDGQHSQTSFTYDGLGRQLTETNNKGVSTISTYDAQSNLTVSSTANGATVTTVHNNAGQIISIQQSHDGVVGTTRSYYDAAGRLRMIKDTLGQTAHSIYDAAGRKVGSVVNNVLTEYFYDADNRLIRSTTYLGSLRAQLVDAGGNPAAVSIDALRPLASGADRTSWNGYDLAGRLTATVDANGYLTRMEYDGAGRLVRTTARAKPIDTSLLSGGTIPASFAGESGFGDRVQRQFFDRDGKLLASLAADGVLTEFHYTAGGQLSESIVYMKPVDAALRANGSLDAMRPSTGTKAVSRKFYDGKNQLLASLDAEGYLTEFSYDAAGNLKTRRAYAEKVGNPAAATVDLLLKRTSGDDRVATFEYDSLNKLVKESTLGGEFTAYAYDAAGNVISVSRGVANIAERASVRRYTEAGQLAAELNEEGAAKLRALGDNPAPADVAALWAAYAVSYTYDVAGNRTSVTDALGNSTVLLYDNNGRLAATINPMGEVEERRYNKLGELVVVSQYAVRLNAAQVASAVAAGSLSGLYGSLGSSTHNKFYYDNTGRLVYTVNAEGAVQQKRYDAFGQVVQSVTFTGRVLAVTNSIINEGYGGGSPVELASVISQPAGGQRTSVYYDVRGRLAYSVNSAGEVEGRSYDAQGNLTGVVHYGARANASALTGAAAEAAGFTALGVRDEQSMIYNLRGLVVDAIDALRSHTVAEYNAFGEVVSSTRLQTVGSTVRSALDATTRTLYDNQGRVRASINANGAVTAFRYNSDGKVIEKVAYFRTVAAADGMADIATMLDNGTLATPARDARQRIVYDANGNAVATLSLRSNATGGPKWAVVAQSFDQEGQLLSRTGFAKEMPASNLSPTDQEVLAWVAQAANASDSDARVRFAYDAAGRNVATATAHTTVDGQTSWSVVQLEYDARGQVLQRAARTTLLSGAAPDAAAMNGVAASDTDSVVRYQYDAVGRVAATATALGGDRWALSVRSYDSMGNIASTTDYAKALTATPPADLRSLAQATPGVDRTTRYTYDSANRLQTSTDAGGKVTRLEYDVRGNVVESCSYSETIGSGTADRISRTVYDLNNRPVYQIAPNGAVTFNRYDALGNLMESVAYATLLTTLPALGATTLTVASDARDRSERFVYDQEGRLRFSVDALGYLQETQYDAQGRVLAKLRYRDPAGLSMSLNDAAFAKAAEGYASANASAAAKVSYTYDAAGNLASTTDELDKTEYYTSDALGHRLTFKNKKEASWSYKYDAAGRLVEEKAPEVVFHSSAGFGEVSSGAAQLVTRMEYDALGNLRSRTEAAGTDLARTTEYRYDTLGRQIKTIQQSLSVYDDSVANKSALERTEKASGARVVTVSYNIFGDAVSNQDVGGNASYKVYDRMGRVAFEIDALGNVTGYERDAFGGVTTLTRYEKPASAAPAGKTYADLSAEQFRPLLKTTPAADRSLVTDYDVLGRAVRVREPLTSVIDYNSTTGNTLLGAARVTETKYDEFGNVQKVSVYGVDNTGKAVTQPAVTYSYYNKRGEKTASVQVLSDNGGQRSGYLTEYSYDAAGNLSGQWEFANVYGGWTETAANRPAPNQAQDRRVEYYYDKANRLTSEVRIGVDVADSSAGATQLLNQSITTSYEYDALGNRTLVTDALKGASYTYYDVLGRTIATGKKQASAVDGIRDGGATLTEFKLDLHGNIVQSIARAVSPTRLDADGYQVAASSADRVTVTRYDAWGRALELIDAEQYAGVRSGVLMSYDVFGRLAKQWRPVRSLINSAMAEETRAVFQVTSYDALGRVKSITTPELVDLVNNQRRGEVTKGTEYNAFGEVTRTTVKEGATEKETGVTYYDQAGRAWMTNSGDGVYKVMFYDVAGNTTSVIRSASASPTALANLKSASEVLGLGQLLRTDTRYDLLGHQQETTQFASAVALVRANGAWLRVEAGGQLPAGGLLVLGDISDEGKALRLRYRALDAQGKPTGNWIDAEASRIQRIEGTPVFNTNGLTGRFEYQVLVRPANEEEFLRSGGTLQIGSAEDKSKDREIIQMYMMMFNRTPNMEEINYWIDGSNKGVSPASMLGFMLQSDEGKARLTGTSRQIVERIFQDGFRITAGNDPAYESKVAKWAMLLEQTGTGYAERAAILLDMLQAINAASDTPSTLFVLRSKALENYIVDQRGTNSTTIDKFLASLTPEADIAGGTLAATGERYRMQIAGLYAAVLGRAATSSELDFYVQAMLNNAPLAAVAEAFLTSPEGIAPNMYPARESNDAYYRQLVNRVYARALNRAPTNTELETWVPSLNAGTLSRAQFAVQFTGQFSRDEEVDAAKLADRNLFNNKVAVALALAKPGATWDESVGRMLMQNVTADPVTQDAVQKALLSVQAVAQLAQMGAAIGTAASAMPVEAARRTLARMYILVLNRLPDQSGMNFYLSLNPSTPAQWEAIAQGMLNSTEGGTVLGNWSALTADAFVKKLYAQLAGSLPNGSNALAQLDSYVASINAGKSRASVVVDMARTMLDLYDLSIADTGAKALMDNRTAVGVTAGLYLPLTDAAQRSVLGAVTATDIGAALSAAYNAAKADITSRLTALRSDENAATVLANLIKDVVTANSSATTAAAALDANAAAKYRLQLTEMYVALLGRSAANPPDISGLQFYVDNNAALTAVAQGFLASSEGLALYNGLGNQAFVDKVYSTMLGSASAVGQGVRDSWVAKLAGANPPSRSQLALDILNSVLAFQGSNVDPANAAFTAARSTFLQKVSATYVKVDENLNTEVTRLNNLVASLKTTADGLSAQLPSLKSARDSTETTRSSTASAATSALSGANAGDGKGLARLEVARLYGALLQRTAVNPPTLADLNLYAPYPLDQVAQWLLDSSEGRSYFPAGSTNTVFVTQLYSKIMGRAADQTGIDFWVAYLNSNAGVANIRGKAAVEMMKGFMSYSDNKSAELTYKKSFDQKIAGFLSSANSQATSAVTSAQGTVNYVNGLIDAISQAQADKAYWEGQVTSRSSAAADGQEIIDKAAARGTVSALYGQLRGAYDYGGALFWIRAIHTTPSYSDELIKGLIADYPASNADFVKELYARVLDRQSVPQDQINFWTAPLDNGSWTKQAIAKEFLKSDQAQSMMAAKKAAVETPLLAEANAAVKAKSDAQSEVTKAAGRLATANSNYANSGLTQASANAALSTAQNAQSAISAINNAHPKVLTADDAAISAATAREAYDAKYTQWQTADTAYRNALNDPLRTKYSTAIGMAAVIKNAAATRATLAQTQATATANGSANINAVRVHQLVQLYATVLKRAPTPTELLGGLDALKASKPFNDIVKGLLQVSSYVGLSNDAFISKMYDHGLGRPIADKTFWLDQLNAGVSREELVTRFLRATNDAGNVDTTTFNKNATDTLAVLLAAPIAATDIDKAITDSSASARQALASGDAAGLAALEASLDGKHMLALSKLYQAILGRAPDANGLAFYLNALHSATPPGYDAIADAMIGAGEGTLLYPATLSNADFVNKVFLTGFGRAATDAEKTLYGGQLISQSRGKVALNIIDAVYKYNGADVTMLGTQAAFQTALAGNFARMQAAAQAQTAAANTSVTLLQGALSAKVPTLYLSGLKVALAQTQSSSDVYRKGTQVTTDRWGNVLTMTDPRNANWKVTYRYNQNGQQVDQTQYHTGTAGSTPHIESRYDKLGRLVATIDSYGHKTAYGFDSNGNTVKEYRADGSIASSEYNLFGNRIQLRSSETWDAVVTDYGYDHLGRLTSTETAEVDVAFTNNQMSGNATARSHGWHRLKETYSYDELGRQSEVRYQQFASANDLYGSSKLKMRLDYDAAGNVIRQLDGAGQATLTASDALGYKIAEKDGQGYTMSWEVDAFGRTKTRTDKGGATMTYAYNALGQQTLLTSTVHRAGATVFGAQNVEQIYENGLLVRIIDRSTNAAGDSSIKSDTRYSYDAAGRRLTEQTVTGAGELVQNNRIRYDAQGRMSHVEDGRFKVDFEYDNNGNRVSVATTYRNNSGGDVTSKVYSSYDEMNRARIINGDKSGATVVLGAHGHEITYDSSGRRKTDTYLYTQAGTGFTTKTTETFNYDAAGRLFQVVREDGYDRKQVIVEDRAYDEQGRVIRSGPALGADKGKLKQFGIAAEARVYGYDQAGNLERMKSWNIDGNQELNDVYYRNIPEHLGGYDAAGTLKGYTIVHGDDDNAYYDNTHAYFDSAKEIQVYGRRDGKTQTTQTRLDANGNVIGVIDTSDASNDKTRTFVNDAYGRVLRTTQGSKVTHTMIVNGEVFGNNDASSDVSNFANAYQSGTSAANLASPTLYNVQSSGETLSSIAKSIWGDASLWYLIADANNLTLDSQLTEGQMLRIPARVNAVHNDAETFNPYNPSEAIGDTRPTLPAPANKAGCGGVGQIVMIVVAVVATIYTAGAAAGLFAGQGVAALGLSAAMTTGAGVFTGAAAATIGVTGAMAAGAIGGAMGSIMSQGVGIAIGAQDKFSWKAVGVSALASGIGAGVAGAAAKGYLGAAMQAGGTPVAMARAALSSTLSNGIGSAIGQQSFSWRNVAAATAAAGVGSEVSGALGQGAPALTLDYLSKATLSGMASSIASTVVRGGKIEMARIAIDAFGNAIGQSLAEQMRDGSQSGTQDKKLLTDKELRKILKDNGQTDYVSKFSRGAFDRPAPADDVAPGGGMNWSKALQEWRTNQPDSVLIPAVEVQGTKWDSLDHLAYMFKTTRESMGERLNRGDDHVYSSRISQASYYRWAQSEASNPVSRELWNLGGLASTAAHNIAASAQGLHRIATDSDARTMARLGLQDSWNNLPRIMAKQADSFTSMTWRQRSEALVTVGLETAASGGLGKAGAVAGNLSLTGTKMLWKWAEPSLRNAAFAATLRMSTVLSPLEDTFFSNTLTAQLNNVRSTAQFVAPDVSDSFATFYHGTASASASSIRTMGVDVSLGNPWSDFGRGFYTTTSREEALLSASRLYGTNDLDVVEFKVPRSELRGLSVLKFESPNQDWADFVKTHKTIAPEEWMHGGDPYDMVTGPLYKRYSKGIAIPWDNRVPQYSIHTQRAQNLFNLYMKQ